MLTNKRAHSLSTHQCLLKRREEVGKVVTDDTQQEWEVLNSNE